MIDAELRRVKAGEIDWSAFVALTRLDWTRLAAKLMRRKYLPEAVTIEDVRQEMLYAAWVNYQSWREDGGQPLGKWVVQGACNAALRWMNVQRNSLRRGSGPSRIPLLYEDFEASASSVGSPLDRIAWLEPTQESMLDRRTKFVRMLSSTITFRERYLLEALVRMGDLDEAVDVVFDDPDARRECRFGSRKLARRAIRRSLDKVISRSDTERHRNAWKNFKSQLELTQSDRRRSTSATR